MVLFMSKKEKVLDFMVQIFIAISDRKGACGNGSNFCAQKERKYRGFYGANFIAITERKGAGCNGSNFIAQNEGKYCGCITISMNIWQYWTRSISKLLYNIIR